MNNTFVGEYVTVYEPISGGGRRAIVMGRVRAVTHEPTNGMQLWVEIEDAECVGVTTGEGIWGYRAARIGDTFCVSTMREYGHATIHIHKGMS